jgi:hypothetical protein
VELKSCIRLRTLSTFKHIPVVVVDSCEHLEDISDLGNNQSVTIINCEQITVFSSLKNIVKVTIQCCPGFTQASDVENARFLKVQSCENFKNFIGLGNACDLNLHIPTKTGCVGPSKSFGFASREYKEYATFMDFLTNLKPHNQKVVFHYDDFKPFRERVIPLIRRHYEVSVEGPVVTLELKKSERTGVNLKSSVASLSYTLAAEKLEAVVPHGIIAAVVKKAENPKVAVTQTVVPPPPVTESIKERYNNLLSL